MDLLLETVGFDPATDMGALRAALRRPGGRVFGGDRAPFARRTHLARGVEILSTYDGLGLWPVFRRGARLEGRVATIDRDPWGPFPLRVGLDALDRDAPRRLDALAWSARREPWRPDERAVFAPGAFALDVAHCGRLGGRDAREHRGPRWIEPVTDGELPGTTYLAAPVLDVQTFENPMSGHAIRAIELDLFGGLTVFVSPWQLEDDDRDEPRPGDWLAGSFALVVERLRVAGIGV